MFRPWPKDKPYTPKRTPGLMRAPVDIDTLAARYEQHALMMSIDQADARAANDRNKYGLVDIHVFPVNRSGRGHSSDFRRCLAARLVGKDAHGAGYYGRPGSHTLNATRIRLESLLSLRGFRFVEVDAAEWAS